MPFSGSSRARGKSVARAVRGGNNCAPRDFFDTIDVMLVKAVLEWSGPARFDEWIAITAETARIGTKSFDVRYRASVDDQPACAAVITYVAVKPGTTASIEIPDEVREVLTDRIGQ